MGESTTPPRAPLPPLPLYYPDSFTGPVVYRFFRQKNWADDLAGGHVWISTLSVCRADEENPARGDKGEGIHTMEVRSHSFDARDPLHRIDAEQYGIGLEGESQVIITNSTYVHQLSDAFVLCTTEVATPQIAESFGRFGVEISQPRQFFELVTDALRRERSISAGRFGRVLYAPRRFAPGFPALGPIGFVKPFTPYASQREVRMLWETRPGKAIAPFALSCPEIIDLCKQVTL